MSSYVKKKERERKREGCKTDSEEDVQVSNKSYNIFKSISISVAAIRIMLYALPDMVYLAINIQMTESSKIAATK